METTMAATPKARLASRDREPALAFPIPPAPASSPSRAAPPSFAFPPPACVTPTNGIPALSGRLEPDPLRDTVRHRPTVRTRIDGSGSVTSSLELFAHWVERAPMPVLPDGVWTFLGRAWFFIAGTSLGILFAFAVIAVTASASPATHARARVASNDASVRTMIIQKVGMSPERTYGELASNDDVVEAAPPVATVRPRTAAVRRTSTTARRPANGAADILNAGL